MPYNAYSNKEEVQKMKVYIRQDNPEKNKIGNYKVIERKARYDSEGMYILWNKKKVYVYENGAVRYFA